MDENWGYPIFRKPLCVVLCHVDFQFLTACREIESSGILHQNSLLFCHALFFWDCVTVFATFTTSCSTFGRASIIPQLIGQTYAPSNIQPKCNSTMTNMGMSSDPSPGSILLYIGSLGSQPGNQPWQVTVTSWNILCSKLCNKDVFRHTNPKDRTSFAVSRAGDGGGLASGIW